MAEPQLRLTDIHVMQQTSDTQVIGWKLARIGNASVAGSSLTITQSYAPNDGFVAATPSPAPALTDNFTLVTNSGYHDHWRLPYYKLTVTDADSNSKTYGPFRVEGEVDGISLHLIRNVRTLLRLGGNPVLIYQRIFDQTNRCTCWDPVLKKVTRSNCTLCFNTGFTTGYYDPLLTLALITPEPKVSEPGDTLRQTTATDSLTLNYPVLRPRDVIYEVNTARRFRVGNIRPIEKNRVLIHQEFPIIRLNPSDIEHQLDVPDVTTLIPLIKRIRGTNRQVLQNNQGQSPPVIENLGV
jgi:hypothetical protein